MVTANPGWDGAWFILILFENQESAGGGFPYSEYSGPPPGGNRLAGPRNDFSASERFAEQRFNIGDRRVFRIARRADVF